MKFYMLLFVLCLCMNLGAIEAMSVPDMDDIEYPDDEGPGKEEVELGKVLFFDTRLSINNKQSCASCHNPDLGFGDGLAKGIGTMGKAVGRNTPHIYNLAWNVTFFWDGRTQIVRRQRFHCRRLPNR